MKRHRFTHERNYCICDYCGKRFGTTKGLKLHIHIHLPSFVCSICDKNFAVASSLKNHYKCHAGVLNEICKICNKGYSTKDSLKMHIRNKHFSKIQCEIPFCGFETGLIGHYKRHLKNPHGKLFPNVIRKLLEKLEKLEPDYQNLNYQIPQ